MNELYNLYNDVNLHVRSLENLLTSLRAEDILVPLIVSTFPNSFLHEYGKEFKAKGANVQELLEFLQSECQRYEYEFDLL